MKKIKRKERRALLRKMITLFQLVTLLGLAAAMLMNKMVPMKYLAAGAGILFVLWLICFALQFVKNRVHLLGIFLSIVLSVSQFAGIFYITKASELMDKVGGASYKIDNMVVVVKNDDPAETLADAVDYSYGVQTVQDQVNTQLMLKDIEELFEKPITTTEYEGIVEEAQGLLNGDVQAIIYNEA